MSERTASQPGAADGNLLFGMLALQMEFIGQDRLVAAMQAWVFDKTRSLGQILVGRGDLNPERLNLLSALVAEHLKAHHDDPRQSLASLPVHAALEKEFQKLGDAEVQASLAGLTAQAPAAADNTLPYTAPPDENQAHGTRYHILRPYARGGLGEVLVALDLELHREVALKEIQARYAGDAQSQTRFLLEAEITGRLEHPGIVPVHGLGRHADGRPFYAMRLVQGDTLQEAIRRFHEPGEPARDAGERSLALRRLLTRFVTVCNAVAYAHSRGVIHRDLKPANIMLGKYGETLVLDWGLAKVVGRQKTATAEAEQTLYPLSGDALATQAGSAIGTAAFMSPEQAAGRIDQQGPASDVYSLGATLYALLTGRPPFEGKDTAEILRRVEAGAWVPARKLNKDVPGALDAICRKSMAHLPRDRYASALELGEDLEQWLADEPVCAWSEPLRLRLGRWAKRRPVFAAWIGISIALYLGAIGTGVTAALMAAMSTELLVLLPAFMAILAALAMSIFAQGTATVGAAAGFMAGFLSGSRTNRKHRGARWAALGGRAGLIVGAILGYVVACWFIGFREEMQVKAGMRLTLLALLTLGPVLGILLGMILGSQKRMRVRLSILGGVLGATIAAPIGMMLLYGIAQRQLNQSGMLERANYFRLMSAQLELQKHAAAAQTAAEMAAAHPDSPDSAYDAARYLALCGPSAEGDARLAKTERDKLFQQYTDQALAMLREAIRRGYRDLEHIQHDKNFEPLRVRRDFQELLRELDRKPTGSG